VLPVSSVNSDCRSRVCAGSCRQDAATTPSDYQQSDLQHETSRAGQSQMAGKGATCKNPKRRQMRSGQSTSEDSTRRDSASCKHIRGGNRAPHRRRGPAANWRLSIEAYRTRTGAGGANAPDSNVSSLLTGRRMRTAAAVQAQLSSLIGRQPHVRRRVWARWHRGKCPVQPLQATARAL